jgi:hypothetical protein
LLARQHWVIATNERYGTEQSERNDERDAYREEQLVLQFSASARHLGHGYNEPCEWKADGIATAAA